ncbi:Zinc transporter 7 [Fragariocoptes setiger]|uniref:Zinc transporter 7 n=1 Tax=Fragariocoptes setiger TaxID=1670756 RepID=A0ABQ7SBF5_9ACAR|nr:Zinc transporter 7 [Fragariocoptes setiger]
MQKKLAKFCRQILSDTNSRNLFFFLVLNFFFAFVELFYGLWTNSLGLISDSFHMFFDCSALILGLVASVVSKKGANDKFTYGFGRAEILSGLVNGLFLLFIALFILKEAVERSFEPPEVHHERLFVISVLGFIVNLVGIFVFHHGGQTHSGCSHSHSHNGHDHHHNHSQEFKHHYYESPTFHDVSAKVHPHSDPNSSEFSLDMNGSSQYAGDYYVTSSHINNSYASNSVPLIHENGSIGVRGNLYQSSSENAHLIGFESTPTLKENHSGRGQIMQSVFLHIVADTLGSIGVMISAICMNLFGWMIADPICSIFIAVTIMISVYPLLRDSFYILMQRIPVELEQQIPSCLNRIKNLEGVLSVQEPHFWTLCSGNYVGSLKVEVTRHIDTKSLLYTIKSIFSQINVYRIHIQIDPE